MSAIDFNAEREKIQREIEALERSLGPVARGALSVASNDSDEDYNGFEEQLDGDDEADDLGWEDGCNSAEICLQMNLVYQAVIEEKLQELEILIAQNKDQQDELMWELAGRKTERPGVEKIFPLNLSLGHFFKPYFKDKHNGLGPPANPEMIERSSHTVKTFTDFTITKWKPSDSTELRQAVVSDTLQRMLQPKLLKLEYLQQKRDGATGDIDRKILTKQIQETEREIDDINQLSEDTLVGQRTDAHDWDKISNINFEGVHRAERLQIIWQNYEHPHINKEPWNEEEILKLQEIAEKHNFINWQEIAQELGTKRTPFQCLQRFQLSNKDFKRKEFTKEEDEILTQLVQRMRVGNHIPYLKISYFMDGRDSMQLLHRWTKCLDPSLTKGHWSKEEDELLLKAVAKHGEKDWYKIRFEVPGRSDLQCRERYYKGLHKDIKKGKWSQEEKQKLIELTEKYGVGHWSKVGREITHRTGSQCLSKWKLITGYFKGKQQNRIRKPRPKKVQIKKEEEEEETSTSSDDSSSSYVPSSDSEDSSAKSRTDPQIGHRSSVTPQCIKAVPLVDMWIPRRKLPDSQSRTLIIHSYNSDCPQIARSKSQKKGKRSSFQFNTIMKGIAYTTSTDTVTETPEDFLLEAVDRGCQILQIREDDVRQILRRNTYLFREKQAMSQKQKHATCLPGSESPKKEISMQPVSKLSMSHLCKTDVDRRLLFAVTPWVGNVFLPLSTSMGTPWRLRTHADDMRKKLRSMTITSTPIFTLLIQLFQIDAEGCLLIIRQRKWKETVFLKAFKSSTMTSVQKDASPDPKPPKTVLEDTQSQETASPEVATCRKSKQVVKRVSRTISDPPKRSKVGFKPKPKTVYELLQEKRMQQQRARELRQNTVVLSPNILVSSPLLIHQQPKPAGQPQPTVIAMTSPNTQKATWPVMPFVSIASPNSKSTGESQLPTPTTPCSQSSASQLAPVQLIHGAKSPVPNSSSVPMTWLATPQRFIPFPTPALGFSSPTQTTLRQSSEELSISPGDRPVTLSTSEVSPFKGLEAAKDLKKSPDQTLIAVNRGPAVTNVPTGQPTEPDVQIVASTANQPSKSSEIKLTSKKYPIVKLARVLPKVHTINVPNSVQVLPTSPRPSTQTSPVDKRKNVSLNVDLISLEDEAEVKEWLQGKNGVDVPTIKGGMAYLPPSICTLKTFSRILLQKTALEESAFTLVTQVEPFKKVYYSRKHEIINEMVEEKLKDNPAYHMLKQRFLSAFTFPGFLAAFAPAKSKTAKVKREYDEDSDDSMYFEMNRDDDERQETIKNNDSVDGNSSAMTIHSEQEAPLNDHAPCQVMPAEHTNCANDTERRITRRSVQSRRIT